MILLALIIKLVVSVEQTSYSIKYIWEEIKEETYNI